MSNKLKELIERIEAWPSEQQEDAAELLQLIEAHDRSPYRLTSEQMAEVRRRLAQENRRTLTLAQLDDRLRLLGV